MTQNLSSQALSHSALPRIAWIAPLNYRGAYRSAAYSQAVLPEISKHYQVECFVDDLDLEDGNSFDYPRYHYHRLFERSKHAAFDACVFQIENSLRSQFVRLCAHLYPGICIMHDTFLNRLYYGLYEFTTAPTELNNLIRAEFGDDAPAIGDYHVRGWPYEIFDRNYACGQADIKKFSHALVFRREHCQQLSRMNPELSVQLSDLPVVDTLLSSESKSTSAAKSKWRIVFAGEYRLIDRFDSFFKAYNALRKSGIDCEVIWLHSDQSNLKFIEQSCQESLVDTDIKHLFVSQRRDLTDVFQIEHCIYVSMRTMPQAAWPLGLAEAIASQSHVVGTSTQLANQPTSDTMLSFPAGIGDELWLEKIVSSLIVDDTRVLDSFRSEKKTGVCSGTQAAKLLIELIEDNKDVFAEQLAQRLKRVRDAGVSQFDTVSPLTVPDSGLTTTTSTTPATNAFVEQLQHDYLDSMSGSFVGSLVEHGLEKNRF